VKQSDGETILFVLQNAYRSEKYGFRNRREWSKDLLRSHTGKRLVEMIPAGAKFYVINSSSNIGTSSKSSYRADAEYIKAWVEKINPMIVCACGKIAEDGCKRAQLEFISLPHPAWRALSKSHTANIRQQLAEKIH
jgi:hypothetical protein